MDSARRVREYLGCISQYGQADPDRPCISFIEDAMKYFDLFLSFDGRAGRARYMLLCLVDFAVLMVSARVAGALILWTRHLDPTLGPLIPTIAALPAVAAGISLISLAVRRCHD